MLLKYLLLVIFPHGDLPYKFLGVPISTKKFSYDSCKPLVDKNLARTRTRAAKTLSYVDRAQLVKTILLSVQIFGAKYLVFPRIL